MGTEMFTLIIVNVSIPGSVENGGILDNSEGPVSEIKDNPEALQAVGEMRDQIALGVEVDTEAWVVSVGKLLE
jgi:hypothetical protein